MAPLKHQTPQIWINIQRNGANKGTISKIYPHKISNREMYPNPNYKSQTKLGKISEKKKKKNVKSTTY